MPATETQPDQPFFVYCGSCSWISWNFL